MAEPKRPVGRPRKIPVSAIVEKDGQQFIPLKDAERILGIKPEEEPVKNPDCEPATKAYVKCTLRKLLHKKYKIKHNDDAGMLSFAVLCIGGIISLLVMMSHYSTTIYATILYSVTIGLLFNIIEWMVHYSSSIEIKSSENPKEIERWEPPVCENKTGCDDE
jgi:hypothetical protein